VSRPASPAGPGALEQELGGLIAGVDPAEVAGDDARIAFWLNAYNAVVLREMRSHPRGGSLLRHRRMFGSCAHSAAGLEYTLDAIEHGLLRGNARPPYRARRVLRRGDPRLSAAPSTPDLRIHFALNCGARSCPPPRVYEAGRVSEQLGQATRGYLEAESEFDREGGALVLPGLIKLYRSDFGSKGEQVDFAAVHLPDQAAWIRELGGRLRVSYARFDWTIALAE
jgi:hypothetical protein